MPAHSPLLMQALDLIGQRAYPQAITLLQQAVANQPRHFEPRLQLAKACLDWVQILAQAPLTDIDPGTLSGEAAHYLQLVESHLSLLAGTHPASLHVQELMAMVHLIHDRTEDALLCLNKALSKDPRNAGFLYNQGFTLMQLGRYPEAVKLFSRLTKLHPRNGMGWHMLGESLHMVGEFEEALRAYQQAMVLMPEVPNVYGAMARTYNWLGRHDEAKAMYRSGLARFPDHRDLNTGLSEISLATADWMTGWRYYACRRSTGARMPIPEDYVFEWQPDRPVRVRYDQGLGDELNFLRFLPALVQQGMTIHYFCHPKLFPLLQGQPLISELKAASFDQAEAFDCFVGDLPWLAGMQSTGVVPPPLPLSVDSKKAENLRAMLSAFGPPPYLGLTWQAGQQKEPGKKEALRKLYKEISPATLGDLAHDWPGTVIVMQRAPKPEDLALFSAALGRPWLDWTALNDELLDVLAGLSLLDEYVGVSNTNMHLLAGIGKTARVLMPFPADWRWMYEGDESPWFPGFGIYRQTLHRDWQPALDCLRLHLAPWGTRTSHSGAAE